MSNVTQLSPHAKSVHVEADVPINQRDEFERAIADIVAGERPRTDALDRDVATVTRRALEGLNVIDTAIKSHLTTGGARRLVQFLAGVYNGPDYPFDMTELRGLDTALANACVDYLNYDRLELKRFISIYRTAIEIYTAGLPTTTSSRRSGPERFAFGYFVERELDRLVEKRERIKKYAP
jgi:hypothetical protein